MRDRRTPLYRGKVIDVNRETATLPNGRDCELEIVRHPGGAAALAIDDQQRVCLLRQYRHAAGGWIWELPAGRLEPDEPPLITAQRELEEEAGLRARSWTPLGRLLSSPGVFTEIIHLYLALDLAPVRARPEADECLEVHWVPYAAALARAQDGDIQDAKTVIALFRGRHVITACD